MSSKKKAQEPELTEEMLQQMMQEALFDYTAPRPPRIGMLYAREAMIGYLDSLVCIAGKPKHGKSNFIHALIASAFTEDPVFHLQLRPTPSRPLILYFDTEQSIVEVFETMDRITDYIGSGRCPENLGVFHCRKYRKKHMMQFIEYVIKQSPDASVVIIDGLLDLVRNYNDEEQASDLLEWIRRMTSENELLMIGVIHQSKSSGFTMGHLGSGLDRLASSVIQVEKDKTQKLMTLSPLAMRSVSFDPITIMHDGTRFVEAAHDMIPKKGRGNKLGPRDYNEAEHNYFLSEIMTEEPMSYSDICEAAYIARTLTRDGSREFFQYWKQEGYLYEIPGKRKKDTLWLRNMDKKLFPLAPAKGAK